MYPDSDKPYFVKGMVVCAGAMGAVFVLTVVLRVVLARENARVVREARREGGGEVEDELLAGGEGRGKDRFVLML